MFPIGNFSHTAPRLVGASSSGSTRLAVVPPRAAFLLALLTFTAVTLAGLLCPAVATAGAHWQRISSSEGVSVYVLPDDSRDVPLFKGVTTIKAPILNLLAILTDVDRACEWNLRCHSVRTIHRMDPLNVVFYNRLSAPWPVDDRDAVYRASARISQSGRRVDAVFRAISRPEILIPAGVVRFPRLVGTYRLESLGAGSTRVTYQIDADPGGMVPTWFVRYASKGVPTATLNGLRREAGRIGKRYATFVARYAPVTAKALPTGPTTP